MKMNQVWIVEAIETLGPDREAAHEVYAHGCYHVRFMSWRLSMAPYGSWFNARHDIDLLAKENL